MGWAKAMNDKRFSALSGKPPKKVADPVATTAGAKPAPRAKRKSKAA